jgi:hypothetical protein
VQTNIRDFGVKLSAIFGRKITVKSGEIFENEEFREFLVMWSVWI